MINLTHRVWAGATLALALWVYWRCRSERAAPIATAASACAALFLIQAALGAVVAGAGGGTAIDVIHSSVASLTWLALAVLLALNWTVSPSPRAARPSA